MKDLIQYPTPETDATTIENGRLCSAQTSRDLERRLAACRDALDEIAESKSTPMSLRVTTPSTIAARALRLTAPKQ